MDNVLTYKGYSTHVEFSAEDGILYGKIEGIADLVNFESESLKDVEAAFQEAVDDYLAFCADIGKSPDRVYKGSFNVRVDPQLHRRLDTAARSEGISMNQLVEQALTVYMNSMERSAELFDYSLSESNFALFNYLQLWNVSNAMSGYRYKSRAMEG